MGDRWWSPQGIASTIGYLVSLVVLLCGGLVVLVSLQLQQQNQNGNWWLVSKPIGIGSMLGLGSSAFTEAEVADLRRQTFVKDLYSLKTAPYPCAASASIAGQDLFTALFLESAPTQALDVKPSTFRWSAGERHVPIILGRDFLHLYNFGFAASQGLPQLSESAVKLLSFNLLIQLPTGEQKFTTSVVGFSDRINSILVPDEFMTWLQVQGGNRAELPKRLLFETHNSQDPNIALYLENKSFSSNRDQLSLSKAGKNAGLAGAAVALIALFFLLLSAQNFNLQLRLKIATQQQQLAIMHSLGYEVRHLMLPILWFDALRLAVVSLLACLLSFTLYWYGIQWLGMEPNSWAAALSAGLAAAVWLTSMAFASRAIRKALA